MKNVKITLSEAFLGLIIGTLIGIFMAMTLSYFAELGKSLEPIITMLHSIPQLALAPIYIMWFGIGMTSKVFISSVMVFFLVFFSTFSGIKSMESRLEESAKMLGATDLQIMFKVTLPTSVPWIVSGIRGGLGAALIGAIVGEYLGASSGIGWMISAATSYYNMTRVMTMLFILLVIGGTLNYLLKLAERRLMKYKLR